MTKFEEIGVEIQYDAPTKRRAQKGFQYSCNSCCAKGLRIDCERCAIAHAHKVVSEAFDVIAQNPVPVTRKPAPVLVFAPVKY